MNLTLIPIQKKQQKGTSKAMRNYRKGQRELKNLMSGLNYYKVWEDGANLAVLKVLNENSIMKCERFGVSGQKINKRHTENRNPRYSNFVRNKKGIGWQEIGRVRGGLDSRSG